MNVLSDENVFIGTSFTSMEEVFRFTAEKLCSSGRATEPDCLVEAYHQREQQLSTYIENGMAIPHCKAEQVEQATVIVLLNESPIPWSNEGEFADLIISLAVPERNAKDLHLRILAKLAQSLVNPGTVEQLKSLKEPIEIYDVLHAINQLEEEETG